MILRALALLLISAGAAGAQTLDFPNNASLQREERSGIDSYAMPLGIWENGTLPTEDVEGVLTQQAWRIATPQLTTLQLLRPLREQLRNDRFRILFECQTEACGGFDFRFATRTLPPPEMQINLGDFRFLAARRIVEGGTEYITLFVSRTRQAGFVQVTRVGPMTEAEAPLVATTAAPARSADVAVEVSSLAEQLIGQGRAVLPDLTFETGAAQLGPGPFASLLALADFLQSNPEIQVALVGHTDTAGTLEGNIALSKRRAASVLERLVSDFGVPRGQLAAEGMGYLSPIATNATEEGREENRRVEVIITAGP